MDLISQNGPADDIALDFVPALGIHLDQKSGGTAAVFSAHAEQIMLCLFDEAGSEYARRPLRCHRDQVFFDHFDDLRPGMAYGFRALGPWAPHHGHRFNPQKLLLDPYAKLLDRALVYHAAMLDCGDEPDDRDSGDFMPKAVMPAPFDPAQTSKTQPRPEIPWAETILYEAHIKGISQHHPAVPPVARGRFAGLTSPALVDHLLKLGATTIELLPIQSFMSEPRLEALELKNYWGYNTLGFFAPHPPYGGDDPRSALHECRAMVEKLHEAGFEVILDVVYNHTCESDHLGPTLSFRGLDNKSYYKLDDQDQRRYANPTGCGNALDLSHPRVLQLVMDSLRYWAGEIGVDGFRFDLATTLARGAGTRNLTEGAFSGHSSFLGCLMQDPLLATRKLIMEPWDVGAHGYQLGHFPPGTGEWNDRFRDAARGFWRGDTGRLPALAASLTGSAALFDQKGRSPGASINFITSHDGFTLHDLVSYKDKHNEANGEDNRDGHNHNLSSNHGQEGPTDNVRIRHLRQRHARNLAATLMVSQGVPMWLGGDEILRGQQGNNNAYCQDNKISWWDWRTDDNAEDFLAFIQDLIALRKSEPLLRQAHFLHKPCEIAWWHPDGKPMTPEDWHDPKGHALVMQLLRSPKDGQEAGTTCGQVCLWLMMNAAGRKRRFVFPNPNHLEPDSSGQRLVGFQRMPDLLLSTGLHRLVADDLNGIPSAAERTDEDRPDTQQETSGFSTMIEPQSLALWRSKHLHQAG